MASAPSIIACGSRRRGRGRATGIPLPPSGDSHVRLWLLELEDKLVALERNLPRAPVSRLESDLERCNAMLPSILDLTENQHIDLGPFCHNLLRLRHRLFEARRRLESRRHAWWRRLLRPPIAPRG